MEVKNISWNEHIANKNNHPLLPKSLWGLIVGKSGCGKTTLLLNLLLQPGWLHHSKLSVFGKSLFQPEYKILKKGFEEQLPKKVIMNLFENQNELQREQISPSVLIDHGFPTFLLPCTPSAFRQMSMYPFSISTDKCVPLQHFDRCTCTTEIFYDNAFFHDYS